MRLLFADDHNLLRDALKVYLYKLSDKVEIVEAGSLDEAIATVKPTAMPDLILLDLQMPGMDGLKGIGRMQKRVPTAPIVILSGFFDRRTVLAAIENGARGFIPKTTSGEAMINALRLVMAGEKYLPSSLIDDVSVPSRSAAALVGRTIPQDGLLSKLTERELEILKYVIDGKTNKEIGKVVGLQEITVKVHVRNAYKKLGAANRADAVRIALQHGWE